MTSYFTLVNRVLTPRSPGTCVHRLCSLYKVQHILVYGVESLTFPQRPSSASDPCSATFSAEHHLESSGTFPLSRRRGEPQQWYHQCTCTSRAKIDLSFATPTTGKHEGCETSCLVYFRNGNFDTMTSLLIYILLTTVLVHIRVVGNEVFEILRNGENESIYNSSPAECILPSYATDSTFRHRYERC